MWGLHARRVFACLSLTIFAATTVAQDDLSLSGPPVALPTALAKAISQNPELIAFGYQTEAAQGLLLQADLKPYPQLDIALQDVFGTGDYETANPASLTISLAWVLERGVRENRVDAANAAVEMSRTDAEIARLDVAAETARRFVACMAFQDRLQTAIDGVRFAREIIAAVEVRIAAGRALDAELSRAEAELARAELVQEDYQHELISAYYRLSAQWGETRPAFGSVSGDLGVLPVMEPVESLVARANQNPELLRYMSEQRLYEAQLLLAEAQAKPGWTVYGGVRHLDVVDEFAFVGGVSIPITMGNKNEGRIAAARANRARTDAEAHAARVRVETMLFVLWQELRHFTQTAARLEADVIPSIESALADTRRAYELGRYSYFEWSTVLADLLAANNELLEANIGAHQVVIEIERLTGVGIAAPLSEE
ncbi:MAG: TolC family protein [Candidatus Rariloculaceae bacterium]